LKSREYQHSGSVGGDSGTSQVTFAVPRIAEGLLAKLYEPLPRSRTAAERLGRKVMGVGSKLSIMERTCAHSY